MKLRSLIHIIPISLAIIGLSMIGLARYKIRRICEKYPIEIQMKCLPCLKHGGPWPQRTNSTPVP